MASRSLNEFISKVKSNNFARQNRFTVSISSPAGGDSNLTELFCEQAVLPGISVSTQPVRTYGEAREVVYDRNFESITLTFLVDKQYAVKDFFESWMNKVIDPNSRLVGFYDEYVRDMVIMTQDNKDNDTYYVILRELYPKTIAPIQLDHNSKDIVKLQVTFNYKYHINIRLASPDNDKNPKKLFGLDIPDPYKMSRQLGEYMRGSVTNALNIPDLYFDNFQQFQENLNDRLSISNATSLLERQGQTTGSGLMDWY